MRFFRLITLIFSGAIFAVGYGAPTPTDIDASGEAPILLDREEQPHQRLKFHNWDYKDLGTTAFENIELVGRQPPAAVNQSEKCPDNWVRFADSCYFIEKELLGFAKAERKCAEKQSTLFVANSLEEWTSVQGFAKESYFSWLGLVRFTHYEKIEQLPRWQTEGGIHPTQINWLIKPYKPLVNGWTQFANCAASYKSPAKIESASYTFFYPCTYLLYSICERNSTIINALQ